jgi:hypothetical protein
MVGNGRAWQGMAGHDRAWQGMAGHGRAACRLVLPAVNIERQVQRSAETTAPFAAHEKWAVGG